LISITELGEAQAMMLDVVKNEYLNNLHDVSTDLERMHMDPEFWHQQHNLDSDAHHLNNHMIVMVQKFMSEDATRMETYIELSAMDYEYKHCKGIFARSKLTMVAIRSMHADFYDLPDDTRHNASANSPRRSNHWRKRALLMIPSNYCRPSHRF
jgi:hypothetical protein